MKHFILDSNVLLRDHKSIYDFGEDNTVIIPLTVIRELNKKSNEIDTQEGFNAREFFRELESLRDPSKVNSLGNGIKLESGGTLRVEMNHNSLSILSGDDESFELLDVKKKGEGFGINVNHKSFEKLLNLINLDNDMKILAVTMNLQKENPDKEVILVTGDKELSFIADVNGVKVQKFRNDHIKKGPQEYYKGIRYVDVDSSLINSFYKGNTIPVEELEEEGKEPIYVNEFIVLNAIDTRQTAIGRVFRKNGDRVMDGLKYVKDKEAFRVENVSPENFEQQFALEAMMDDNIPLVIFTGGSGVGKTIITLSSAIHKVHAENKYTSLLAMKPVVAADENEIGFLPGDEKEKLSPWMDSMFDNLEIITGIKSDERFDQFGERKIKSQLGQLKIETKALTYIRGRSLLNQLIYLDEGQNVNEATMKTLITRIGKGSKGILSGDEEQIDNPKLDITNNGISVVIEKMKDLDSVAVVHLSKGVRSEISHQASKRLK